VVSDVPAGTAFPEVVVGSVGQTQGIIKLSEGQETGVGGDGGTVEFQPDFRIELESQRGLFAVTHQVPPGRLRYLKQNAKWMGEL
jgi:hypothetical protein